MLLLFKNHIDRLKGLVGEHKKAGGYKSKKEFRQKLCDQIIVSKGRLNNRKIFLTTAKLKEFKKTYEPAILEVEKIYSMSI
jgi:hypothetical protein